MIPAYLDVTDTILFVQLKDDEMFAIEFASFAMYICKGISVAGLQRYKKCNGVGVFFEPGSVMYNNAEVGKTFEKGIPEYTTQRMNMTGKGFSQGHEMDKCLVIAQVQHIVNITSFKSI
jgi:hypothetical protein